MTNAIQGSYLPGAALEIMLAGTGLEFAQANRNDAYVIRQIQSEGEIYGSDDTTNTTKLNTEKKPDSEMNTIKNNWLKSLAAVLSLGIAYTPNTSFAQNPDEGEPFELPAFVVVTEEQTGYLAANVYSGTRTRQLLRDLPKTINVVTADFLDDLSIFDLAESTRYSSGIIPHASENAIFNENVYTIRGFRTNIHSREGVTRLIGPSNSAGIERVEIVKGPSSLLYGQISPAGTVNYIMKRPLGRKHAEVGVSIGSWENYRATLDVGNSFGTSEASWRLNAAFQDTNTWRDFENFQNTYLAPSFNTRFNNGRTVLTVWAEWLDRQGSPGSIPVRRVDNTGPADGLPWSFNANGPDGVRDQRRYNITAELVQDITSWVDFRFFYDRASDEIYENTARVLRIDPNGETMNRNATLDQIEREFDTIQASLLFERQIGEFNLNFLVGYDRTENEQDQVRFDNRSLPRINWRNPTPEQYAYGDPSDYTRLRADRKNQGVTSAWFGTLHGSAFDDRLHFLFGVRDDSQEAEVLNRARGDTGFTQTADRGATVEQYGLSYRITPNISIYGSFAESYLPPGRPTNNDGTVTFGPQVGEGTDIGFKFSLFEQRVSGTVAWFDIDNTNIVRFNPSLLDGEGDWEASGLENSNGIEADLVLNVTPDWTGTLSVTQLNAEVVNNVANPATNGARLPDAPEFQFSTWQKYTVPSGPLEGAEFGVGAIYLDERVLITNSGNEIWVDPAYWRFDLMVSYPFQIGDTTLRAKLNVRNLSDEEYLNQVLNYGNPREVIFSLNARF